MAQANELSLTGGGYFPSSSQVDLGTGWAVEGSFAHRIFSVPLVGIYAEFPLAHNFNTAIKTLPGSYTGTFFTPGLKLKFAPGFFASPYLAAGVGLGHLHAAAQTPTALLGKGDNSAAYDFGGGLDIKVFPFVSLRAEVRDFNSGGLGFAVPGISSRQNHLFVTGGVVLRF